MMIPDELVKDLEILKEREYSYETIEVDQRIYITFKEYPLPSGIYNLENTDLMIFTICQYPNAGFDMFWVEEQLKLKNDSIPKNGEAIEPHMGKNWRRFSYHPYQDKPWDPANDSVIRYLSYIDQRLRRGD